MTATLLYAYNNLQQPYSVGRSPIFPDLLNEIEFGCRNANAECAPELICCAGMECSRMAKMGIIIDGSLTAAACQLDKMSTRIHMIGRYKRRRATIMYRYAYPPTLYWV